MKFLEKSSLLLLISSILMGLITPSVATTNSPSNNLQLNSLVVASAKKDNLRKVKVIRKKLANRFGCSGGKAWTRKSDAYATCWIQGEKMFISVKTPRNWYKSMQRSCNGRFLYSEISDQRSWTIFFADHPINDPLSFEQESLLYKIRNSLNAVIGNACELIGDNRWG